MACFVKNCKNIKRLLPLNSGITFHRFPTDDLMYKKWLEAIGRDEENKVRSQNMVLCSDHFCLEDFVHGREVRRIKKFAIPLSNKFFEENISSSPIEHDSKKISSEVFYPEDFNCFLEQEKLINCAVVGCINRLSKKSLEQLARENSGVRISFYKFPNSAEIRAAWINAINRADWKPEECSVICSDHFTNDSFDKSIIPAKLLPNSIPTVFPTAHYNRLAPQNNGTEIIDFELDSMPEQPPTTSPSSSVSTSADDLFSEQGSTDGYNEPLDDGNVPSYTTFLQYKRQVAIQEMKNRSSMYEKKIEILSQKNKQQQKTISTLRKVLAGLKRKKKQTKIISII